MSYDVNGQKISLKTGEGIFVNSRCFHYGYSDSHTECFFICILLSPLLLSVNTYFVQNWLDPLIRNVDFTYQKLTSAIPWQNSILRDLELLYENNGAGNCCKTKCTSLFQKYLNTSPMLYLNRYRLEKSVFLLRNTAMSITEIAYACGFSNTSYFCELFHKYYHTTPEKFRIGKDPDLSTGSNE